MKTKKIGIVLEKMELCRISGYLCKVTTALELGGYGNVVVNTEIGKNFFDYYPQAGYYEIMKGVSFENGVEIGKELKKIGFENVKLLFNDELHDIE